MGIVVTGSAGMLGSTSLRRLHAVGRPALGVDLNPGDGRPRPTSATRHA